MRWVWILLACVVTFTVNAQHTQRYYRWKDAGGVTHYGDTPPAGVHADAVDVRPGVTAGDDAGASADTSAGSGGKLEQAEANARVQNCARAQDNLRVLDGGAMLVDSDDPTKAKRMTPDEIDASRRRAQADVTEYCGKTP